MLVDTLLVVAVAGVAVYGLRAPRTRDRDVAAMAGWARRRHALDRLVEGRVR